MGQVVMTVGSMAIRSFGRARQHRVGVGLMGAARVLAMLGLQVALPRGWRIR
jgi:hypothetical protein